ncbi:MAG: hypothetical protein ACK4WM_04320 [Thermoflexales bacterium]
MIASILVLSPKVWPICLLSFGLVSCMAATTSSPPPTRPATPTPAPTATALPTPAPVPWLTPQPTRPLRVHVRPLAEVADSYRLHVRLAMDGTAAQRYQTQGDLQADVEVIASARQKRLTLSGGSFRVLFGDRLPLPVESLSVYFVGDRAFVWLPLFVPVCATFAQLPAELLQARDGLSEQALLAIFADERGLLSVASVADETLNDMAVRRYVLDVDPINRRVRGTKLMLRGAELWLAQPAEHLLRLRAELGGDLRALGLNYVGNTQLDLTVHDINALAPLTLPGECNKPLRW